MSANTMLKVEGAAWSIAAEEQEQIQALKTSRAIVSSQYLDYTVSAHNMKTDIDEPVPGYWAMYRDDTNKFLGPVKSNNPIVTQNVDSFRSFEPLIADGTIKPVTVGDYAGGSQIFCCFQINETFDVLDDSFRHYFIVVNDHLRPDGNLMVINTPIRIVCMNALSAAISKSRLKFKVPAVTEGPQIEQVAQSIMGAYKNSVVSLQNTAKKLVDIQISRKGIDKLLDELFPYLEESEDGATNHTRANQTVSMQREAFIACLDESNLSKYQGTMWQVYNALTDYTQHYFRSGDRGFNLQHRMTLLPGLNPEATSESLKVSKFLNNIEKFQRSRKIAA